MYGATPMPTSQILTPTKVSEIPTIVGRCRRGFKNNLLRTAEQRKVILRQIVKLVADHEDEFVQMAKKDLGRPRQETLLLELKLIQSDAFTAIDNVSDWMKPKQVKKEGIMVIEDCFMQADPLGTVCIIGAWNYPTQLTLLPLIGAIAAGNTVVLKPSEVSENSSALLTDLLPKYISEDICSIVNGGVPESTALLAERFNHIFYTGNGRVGRIIMAAAAKNLTPVTLELGGKSPTIVDDTCGNLTTVAQRIVWGRILNCGQTCIAPDYVLVKEGVKDRLIDELRKAIAKFLGDNPRNSPDYGRVINDMHFNRLCSLMKGGKVVVGGETDPKTRYIAPTILTDVDVNSTLMTDEIFGPLLPVVTYRNVEEAIDFVNVRDKPLAMYIFSRDGKFVDNVLKHTSAGGVTVNDTLMHAGIDTLPFGGVGESGMGGYHGKHSFDVFSHKKGVMNRKLILEATNFLRYPPYCERTLGILSSLLFRQRESRPWLRFLLLGTLAAAVAGVTCLVLKQKGKI